jgi:hypothetical protein
MGRFLCERLSVETKRYHIGMARPKVGAGETAHEPERQVA